MKARLLREMVGRSASDPKCACQSDEPPKQNKKGQWVWPAGTVITHPDAYRLVQQGVAEPFDERCEQVSDRTPEQLANAQDAYEKVSKGIHPEDYDKYDAGQITGYNPDGSYIKGPNWIDDDDAEEDDE